MTKPPPLGNNHDPSLAGTAARDLAEARIEGVRDLGGVFVEAVRATRMPMVLADPTLSGNPIVFANQAFLELSGYAMDEVLGQQPHFMNGPDTDPEDAARFRQILADDKDGVVETIQYAKNGRRFVATVLLSAFKDHDGRTINHFLSWTDVTRRVDAEEESAELRTTHAALRESEERQAFLLSLGDAVRLRSEATAKIEVAARLLGERLNASRVLFAEFDEGRGVAEIFNGWFADGAEPFPTVMPLAEYEGPVLNDLRTGRTVRIDDVGALLDQPAYAAIAAVGVRALLSVPLMVSGRLAVNLSVHQHEARPWTDEVVVLVHEVAERLWAEVVRARSEAALRESEERFREFGENSSDVLWIADLEAMKLDYLSPAYERIWGENRERLLADYSHWAETIHPDDLVQALQAMPRLMSGEAAVADYRIVRPDGSIRWFRDTGFPMRRDGKVVRGGGIAQDVTDLHLADERQKLLLAELQHRVRNIMAMVRAVVRQTSEGYASADNFVAHLVGRLDAMARTQALLTRALGAQVNLEDLIRDELQAQVADEARVTIRGEEVSLSPKAAEVLTLAIHELATNSVKYGALADPGGRLSIVWEQTREQDQAWLAFTWREHSPALKAAPHQCGFGTELIEQRVPYELRGRASLEVLPDGLRAEIAFPLIDGSSILETGPARGGMS